MIITYNRPDTIGQQIDPKAPAADLYPEGAVCAASTWGVVGTEWTCTRRPGHTDDEHRATFEKGEDGPERGGAGYGPSSTEPVHSVTVTVTFPESASTGVTAEKIAANVLSSFWECDHDHVRTIVTHDVDVPATAHE